MTNKSKKNINKSDFRTDISEYNNEEIVEILKKRRLYQKEVADQAIKEAIKRGIINTEQDLFSNEYDDEPHSMKLFPVIKDKRLREKITKSIARTLLIIGAIPGVWGILNIIENKLLEGILLLLFAGIWIYGALQLLRSYNSKFILILFVMMAASVLYIIKLLIEFKGLGIMDYFIPIILISFITYGLLYLKILNAD